MSNYENYGEYKDKHGKYRITTYDVYFKIIHAKRKYCKNLPEATFDPMRVTPQYGGRAEAIKIALTHANRRYQLPSMYKIAVQKTKIIRRAAYSH